jgi:acetylornithine deacetylase/succinyl-diaminopimelate desuccinylase-like protein
MRGIPTILIGAGEMGHCPDEYVSLERLREAFRSYVGLALELLSE